MAYKEEIIHLAVFSNTKLSFKVRGGGKQWYASYKDITRQRRVMRIIFIIGVMLIGIVQSVQQIPFDIANLITITIILIFLIYTMDNYKYETP